MEDEEGVPPKQRAANAEYIGPTKNEIVTLLTCWPPKGPDTCTQRVVVRPVPFGVKMGNHYRSVVGPCANPTEGADEHLA